MKFIIFFLFSFMSYSLTAQFGTPEAFESNYVKQTTLAVATDINGDGWKDVVSYSPFKNYIVWTEYYPCDATWGMPAIIFQFPSNISHLNSADIDGDGLLDIIVSSDEGDIISWLQNLDAQGSFSTPKTVGTTLENTPYFELVDVDKDEDLDIFSASPTEQAFVWFENTGSGVFSDKKILSDQFEGAKLIKAIDIDSDNDLDIIGCTDKEIVWFENLFPVSTFTDAVLIDTVQNIQEFIFSDINKDDHIDIVTTSSSQQTINWYRNLLGTGAFNERTWLADYSDTDAIAAGDMDQDGDDDLIVASFDELEQMVWLEHTETSGFIIKDTLLDRNVNSFNLVDINDDNLTDILVAGYANVHVTYLKNQEKTLDFSLITAAYRVSGLCGVWSGDFDQDGHIDIATITTRLRPHRNLGYGDFKFERGISASAGSGRYFHDCVAGDLDNDNDLDLVYTDNYEGVGILVNEENIFSRDYLTGGQSVDIGDIDGDGDLDIMRASWRVSWLENELGTFDLEHEIDDLLTPDVHTLKLGDYDNDGDLDVFCIGKEDMYWCENLDGLGNFDSGTFLIKDYDFNIYANKAHVGDIDQDGDLDLVYSSGSIKKIENSEVPKGFDLPSKIDDIAANDFELIDFDQDGDLDIVGSNSYEVFWLENINGTGLYEDPIVLFEIEDYGPSTITVNDFDQDGDLDILSSFDGFDNFDSWYFFIENLTIDSLSDNDNDGYYSNVDCDDNNAAINPCAEEILNNGVDEDCDGEGGAIFNSTAEISAISFSLYPNPTYDLLTIETNLADYGHLHIFDATGQSLLKRTVNDLSKFAVDLNKFPTGLYFIHIHSKKIRGIKKVIKL